MYKKSTDFHTKKKKEKKKKRGYFLCKKWAREAVIFVFVFYDQSDCTVFLRLTDNNIGLAAKNLKDQNPK